MENIGEHTFLEGLYYAWKATGDTEWMKSRLDHALRAVHFATSSPWYWSKDMQLLKRPFSIDRWDFQSDLDAKITQKDFMGTDLEKTRYGIMYGDNICLANGCEWLSEMLEVAERPEEAKEMRMLSQRLWQRINDLSWNGNFYRHWVPVENQQDLDFGVDTEQQVTLSNAMALLRGLDHERAVKIIKSYQKIRREMPDSSPGEWYMCYPPFEHGWHIPKWEYMNGGVSPIVAGDLALGAFEHGFEEYGSGILQRLLQLAKRSPDQFLKGGYKGKMPDPPPRNFTTISLAPFATHGLTGGKNVVNGWPGGDRADFRNLPTGLQNFEGIRFDIVDPDDNQGKSCVLISSDNNSAGKLVIPIGQKAQSIYLLQTAVSSDDIAGIFIIQYVDGSIHQQYIRKGKEIGHYWYPVMDLPRQGIPSTVIAWHGPSRVVKEVGAYAFGMDNPNPDTEIESLEFYNPMDSSWILMGLTLSDSQHYFDPPISSTIPDHWAAAHVFKALMEGMAGVVNTGLAFDQAELKPRWEVAGVNQAEVTACYAASKGYLHYRYQKRSEDQLEVDFCSSGEDVKVELLLPAGKEPETLLVNTEKVLYTLRTVENSQYVCTRVQGIGAHNIILTWY